MIDWKAVKKAADESFDERWDAGTMRAYRPDMSAPMTEEEARQIARRFYLPRLGAEDVQENQYVDPVGLSFENGNLYVNGNRVVENDRGLGPLYTYENGSNTMYDHNGLVQGIQSPDGGILWDRALKLNALPTKDEHNEYTLYGASRGILYPRSYDLETARQAEIKRLKDEAWNNHWNNRGPEPDPRFERIMEFNMIDPDGYLASFGITPETPMFPINDYLRQVRMNNAYMNYLRDNNPEEYARVSGVLGVDPLTGEKTTSFNQDEQFQSWRKEQLQNSLVNKEQRAAQRWGNNQISLTPEQYAYYDAKRQLQANPGSQPHWNAYLKAKQPMRPNDLGQVNKYTVQQRMMSTPQPNGRPKTPAMLQQEWQQENHRRQNLQKEMYKGEMQGLKNRTGVQPTPTNTWNY